MTQFDSLFFKIKLNLTRVNQQRNS